ncbi:hypothetical protein [Helicobacter sp. 11S02596-1]|uniref:coiled-coil domain-containing protein n=1 Tax=Helicobacter sp. 11S02596-1 TaxID=1476194 RepID=UPI000BA5A722|nr:hypothetical protein [Helicobacter sp. 11S02596-1]PAF42493.1 hypothetical protein BJI48_06760 [Helicobacter sp. 11S02596-1]
MDCSLLYTITMDMLEQGRMRSKSLVDFNQNIIGNLSFEIKKILQDHPIDSGDQNCQEYVRRSIADFYRKNGMNAFIYFDKSKNISVSAVIKDPNANLSIFFLSKWLQDNKNQFKSEISDDKPLSQEDFNQIFEYARTCVDSDNELVFRDVVRNAVKKTFNFNSRDGLFFSKLGVYLKTFDFNFVKISNEIRSVQKLSAERLLSDEDRFKINNHLKNINLDDLILKSTAYVLDTKIDLDNTSNMEFYKNFHFYMTQELRLHLEEILGEKIPSMLQTCFAEEKVRSRRHLIFEEVAKRLLELVYQKSKGAMDFVSFYRGQIVRIENQEVFAPIILDNKGEKYSLAKIQNVVNERFEVQIRINALQNGIQKAKQAGLNLETDINEIQNQIAEKNKTLSQTDAIYEKKKKELLSLRGDEMIQKETISVSLTKYLEEKKSLLNQIEICNKQIEQIRNKKLELIQKQKNIEHAIEEEKEKSQSKFIEYNMLVTALSNAIGGIKLEL